MIMYNGIVNIYKEQGFTSHDVVAKLRGIYGQKKIGHTGTLDPMAEGVLIVVLGSATKLADLIVSKRKKYIAGMKFGAATTTDDITGEIISSVDEAFFRERLSDKGFEEELRETMAGFLGESMQIPPRYSAIKVNGKKLYEYARAGIEVEIEPRPIQIYSMELKSVDKDAGEVTFEVECSKGTYIRSLIRDIGEKMGLKATMSSLLRGEVNGVYAEDGYRLSDLQKMKEEGRLAETVLKTETLLAGYPKVSVKPEYEKLLQNGNRLPAEGVEPLGDGMQDFIGTLRSCEFFSVFLKDELRALYTYDKKNNNLKVYKML